VGRREGVKLGVGGASSFSSQIACVCQQQWGELCFGSGNDHAELTGVTLAVKLPSKPGSPPFLQSLQTTKWFYLKNKIIKWLPSRFAEKGWDCSLSLWSWCPNLSLQGYQASHSCLPVGPSGGTGVCTHLPISN